MSLVCILCFILRARFSVNEHQNLSKEVFFSLKPAKFYRDFLVFLNCSYFQESVYRTALVLYVGTCIDSLKLQVFV